VATHRVSFTCGSATLGARDGRRALAVRGGELQSFGTREFHTRPSSSSEGVGLWPLRTNGSRDGDAICARHLGKRQYVSLTSRHPAHISQAHVRVRACVDVQPRLHHKITKYNAVMITLEHAVARRVHVASSQPCTRLTRAHVRSLSSCISSSRAGEWDLLHYVVWAAVITLGYELLSWLVLNVPPAAGASLIPNRAPHLDQLEWRDISCAFAFLHCKNAHNRTACCARRCRDPITLLLATHTLSTT
jgi:hypothetical protein